MLFDDLKLYWEVLSLNLDDVKSTTLKGLVEGVLLIRFSKI